MTERLSEYGYEDLLRCARGEMFGEGNPQLPMPPMLMFDKITEISDQGGDYNKGLIRAELKVKPNLWFFSCHFKGDPVMPGCLGLDALWQMTGFFLGWLGEQGRGRAISVGQTNFTGMITPSVSFVEYYVHLKRVVRSRLVLAIADGLVKADGELIYRAENIRVGLFGAPTKTG